jgi:membrane protein DedA with SNARE-associated domain
VKNSDERQDAKAPRKEICVFWRLGVLAFIQILCLESFLTLSSLPMHVLAISIQTVNNWINAGGAFVLFGLLFACGLGLPLPEDIPLLVAGALVAQGKMHLAVAAIAGWCGIIGGDIMLYSLGKKFGMEITKLPFVGKHLTQKRIERVQKMFENYGVGVVAVGRLFAGIRGAMVVAAGAIRFNFITFIIADGLAAIVSGGFFLGVGYWLGSRLDEHRIKEFKHWFIFIASLGACAFVGWIMWKRRRDLQMVEKMAEKVDHTVEKVVKVAHLTPNPSKDAVVAEPKSDEKK